LSGASPIDEPICTVDKIEAPAEELSMYASLRRLGIRQWLLQEAPSLSLALIVAELVYKFHSFTLECVAFMATWLAFGWVARVVSKAISRIGIAYVSEPRSAESYGG
jgi:hypothetical protein